MNKNYELRENMANFIRKCMWSDIEFTLEDICESCGLSYVNRFECQRVYSIIVNWKSISIKEFTKLDKDSLLEEYGSKEQVWEFFLKKLNEKNIFFLNVNLQDPKMTTKPHQFVYFQPSWTEKETIDYFRFKKQIKGSMNRLREMDKLGGKFPVLKGGNLSPKELENNLKKTLDEAQFETETLIANKIKKLEEMI